MKYIDTIMSGYGKGDKEMAGFEKRYMGDYVGNAPIDHVLFRKFLRLLNDLYNIDQGQTLIDALERLEQLSQQKQDRNDTRLATDSKSIVGAINELDKLLNKVTATEDGELTKLNIKLFSVESNKQDKTDASLQTDSKSVTGAINEVLSNANENESNIKQLNSDVSQLEVVNKQLQADLVAAQEKVQTLEADNSALRKELAEVKQLTYAAL
jgi:peptidoglycan hydrolase CwlO-like protein